jgi:hypothetical protein
LPVPVSPRINTELSVGATVFTGRQRFSQRAAVADDVVELLVELALEVLLFVGQPCIDAGELLVRAGILHGDGDLRRRLPEEGDLLFRERHRRRPSDVQRADLSVGGDERHAAH